MTCDPSLLTIREATEDDANIVAKLTADAGMGTLTPRGTVFVAVSEGRTVGFIRIVEAEGHWYVNPIVVAPAAWASDVRSCRMLGHDTVSCCSLRAVTRFLSTKRSDARRWHGTVSRPTSARTATRVPMLPPAAPSL